LIQMIWLLLKQWSNHFAQRTLLFIIYWLPIIGMKICHVSICWEAGVKSMKPCSIGFNGIYCFTQFLLWKLQFFHQ
jgi:hypothetical protein